MKCRPKKRSPLSSTVQEPTDGVILYSLQKQLPLFRNSEYGGRIYLLIHFWLALTNHIAPLHRLKGTKTALLGSWFCDNAS
jgi:hypothetical protein